MKTVIQTPAFIQKGEMFIPIALYDKLTIETINERKVQLRKTRGYKIPTNDKNPVFKAIIALQKLRPNKFGVTIRIEKNIPTFSGLHSQLSNAAGTLITLNRLWKFNLNNQKLLTIAQKIDPEMLTILKAFFNPPETKREVILIRPKHIIIDPAWAEKHDPMLYFPDLKALTEDLKEWGAKEAGLSGKRSVIFGEFDEKKDLKALKKKIQKKTDFIWIGNACHKGGELIN